MKMETITVSPGEQRVLLMFDPEERTSDDQQVQSYLDSNGLEPRRIYRETRDESQYEVHYFGYCYIESHLDSITSLASGD